jgi:hypothetical protein
MQFKDDAVITVEEKVSDGFGGYEITRTELKHIKVKTAPYKVEVGEICTVPNPSATVKFFTKDVIDEDLFFYITYKGKTYKKVSIIDYGKCIMIAGERI